jgi:hypothetical protein
MRQITANIDYKAAYSALLESEVPFARHIQKVKVDAFVDRHGPTQQVVGMMTGTAFNIHTSLESMEIEGTFESTHMAASFYSLLYNKQPHESVSNRDGFSDRLWETMKIHGAPTAPGLNTFTPNWIDNFDCRAALIDNVYLGNIDCAVVFYKLLNSLILYTMDDERGTDKKMPLDLIFYQNSENRISRSLGKIDELQVLSRLGFMEILGKERLYVSTKERMQMMSMAYLSYGNMSYQTDV